MKVLVTGGAGFIGSHIVDLLLKEGAEVRVFDSLVSGKREQVPEEVEFVQGDIRDQDALAAAMKDMTHVVHLAAQVSVPASIEDPLYTHEVNVIGTKNVLEAARHIGVKRLVYASSAAVYGDHPELPKTEESPLQPKSPYATSKITNEVDALASGLSTIGLRFFNVYGPGQDANHPYASVIPRWVAAAREGRQIELHGDGTQTRDFIHVHDIAHALLLALKSAYVGVYNIASGEETTLNDLLHVISGVCHDSFDIKNEPARKGDILRSVADTSVARRVLNFTPSVQLADGISKLLTI